MMSCFLIVDQDCVCCIVLNCLEVYNVFDDVLIVELIVVIEDVGCDDYVCVIVFIGEGESFFVGVDLNWMCLMVQVSEQQNCDDLMCLV